MAANISKEEFTICYILYIIYLLTEVCNITKTQEREEEKRKKKSKKRKKRKGGRGTGEMKNEEEDEGGERKGRGIKTLGSNYILSEIQRQKNTLNNYATKKILNAESFRGQINPCFSTNKLKDKRKGRKPYREFNNQMCQSNSDPDSNKSTIKKEKIVYK